MSIDFKLIECQDYSISSKYSAQKNLNAFMQETLCGEMESSNLEKSVPRKMSNSPYYTQRIWDNKTNTGYIAILMKGNDGSFTEKKLPFSIAPPKVINAETGEITELFQTKKQ